MSKIVKAELKHGDLFVAYFNSQRPEITFTRFSMDAQVFSGALPEKMLQMLAGADGILSFTAVKVAKPTYGLKKGTSAPSGLPCLYTTTGAWLSAAFVGLGSNHAAKEWKTEAGARRAAERLGGEVFTITEIMNY